MESPENIFSKPRIAVIMSVYNERPEWLRKSIESILEQTWENLRFYIALDNPSNNELNQILREYAVADSRIALFPNDNNMGLVKSLNKLIGLTDEPYIARMDADDISLPHRLEQELSFLQDNNLDFVMSGANLLSEDDEIIPGRDLPDLTTEDIAEIQKYANVSIHPSWLMKRTVYENLHGYRNIDSCEDFDFVLRAIQHGYTIGRMSEPLLQYRFRETSISHSNALIQDERTHILQNAYKKGLDLESAEIILAMEEAGERSSQRDNKRAILAKKHMGEFTQSLYKGKLVSCARIALPNLLINNMFRREFIDSVKARAIIGRITSDHNS